MKDRNAPVEMIYNTQQEFLIMPEYGRNVQQLVRHLQTIKDPEYRQAFCEEIINLIQQLYPQSKNVEDYRDKLWHHLFHIAKYDLDARTPNGQKPRPEDARVKPERVPYPLQDTRFRHYGNNVQLMIKKAIKMEPGYIKTGFVNTIGSYMKMAYKTWNREHFVSDDLIKNDLAILSNNQVSLDDDSRIDGLANASRNKSSQSLNPRDRDRDRNRTTQSGGGGGLRRDNRNDSRSDNRNDNRGGGDNRNRNNNNGGSNSNRSNINSTNNINKNKRK